MARRHTVRELKNKDREFEQIIGIVIALIIAVAYHEVNIYIIPPNSLDFLGDLAIWIIVGFPGMITFVIYYIYSKNLSKSIIYGFLSIIVFLILVLLTTTPPGLD